ncbi:TonB-dependent receptor plug domain-containing protein [Desulfobacula phenolica]|uniref:Vitamin B12 transporter n=1 Tax=Desulfobacula phenolica TaxID=90732 RepID=A0A1H2JYN5_9BACT|nr:TonB-dependent receptor [Desulfobacula phenolica]SDU61422.1 vitamin B12 transporter [Desulfobacula phenolica]
MNKSILAVMMAAVMLLVPVMGQSLASDNNQSETKLEDIVVTVGRVTESKKEIVNNVTVIDEQEIRLSSARDVGDLLAQKGIGAIKKYPGNLTTIGIRGFRTDSHGNDLKGHVLILLNGRRAGTGNVAKIMTKNVERIEIIRGPASILYGSAAVGGVVNVITRQGKGKLSAFGEGNLGSFGHEDISAGFAGEYNGFDFSGSVTRETEDDYTTANGTKYHNTGFDSRESISMNMGYTPFPNNRIAFLYHGFNVDEAGSPSYLSQNDLDDYTDKSNYSFDIVLDGQTTDSRFVWKLKYFQGKDEDTWNDPTGSNPDGWDDAILSEQKTESKGIQAQISVDLGQALITTGFDWADYDIEASWNPQKTSYENPAGFLLGKLKLLDDRLTLSAGLRYDTYEVEVIDPAGKTADDNNLTPNIGLSYLLTDYLKLRAGYSEAFVMPGADQMAAAYSVFGSNYVGNPDLSPETSKTCEGGLDVFYRSLSGSLGYFYTDFKDKIESVTRTNADRSWENVGEARISGFEGNLSVDIGDYFGWDFEIKPFVGFTYLTEYEDRITGNDLLETSDLTASYGISVSDLNGFSARLNFAYFGEKTITDYESGWPYQDIKARDFTVADLTITKVLFATDKKGRLALNASINNLFDEEYEYIKGYPMPERNFYVGMRYDF